MTDEQEMAERDFFELYDGGGHNRDLIDSIGVDLCRDLYVLAYLRGVALGHEREHRRAAL